MPWLYSKKFYSKNHTNDTTLHDYALRISFYLFLKDNENTCNGWVIKSDVNNEIIIDVNHLVHLSLPKLIPFIIMKNTEIAANKNDNK